MQQQPEAVYYYPGQIECKAKWDVTQIWDPRQTPLYKQKPSAITKQKAETVRIARGRNAERARNLGIEYNPKNGLEETKKTKKKFSLFKRKKKTVNKTP